jgi:N-ethylmaleimide reductase
VRSVQKLICFKFKMTELSITSPVKIGDLELKNRVFMSPMARTRVVGESVISPLAATYYAQRASAGLIVSESIIVAKGGEGGPLMPGIYTQEQIEGWKKVTDAVHANQGIIFAQLNHNGRVSLPEFNNGKTPIAPSAVEFNGAVVDKGGKRAQPPVPRALETEEVREMVNLYKTAAANAKTAGFDGVELHAGNAGLAEQFLHPFSNIRQDKYGGPITNRARFILEIIDCFIDIFGKERVGIRLSPHDRFSDQYDPEPVKTIAYLSSELEKRKIAYIHILEPAIRTDPFLPFPEESPITLDIMRAIYKGAIIVNGSYSAKTGNAAINNRGADAVSFGRPFIANPDLPHRLENNLPLKEADPATFYGTSEEGYIN